MATLFERYPRRVQIGRYTVPVNLTFWRVVLAIRINNEAGLTMDDKISTISRTLAPWSKLMPFLVQAWIVQGVFRLLFGEEPKNDSEPRYMDLEQDAASIKAAFLQAYRIDLSRSSIHWYQFRELLSAIPEETTFAKIVELRRRPLPKPNKYNKDEIEALQKAKAAVALDIPDEERDAAFAASLKKASIFFA